MSYGIWLIHTIENGRLSAALTLYRLYRRAEQRLAPIRTWTGAMSGYIKIKINGENLQ